MRNEFRWPIDRVYTTGTVTWGYSSANFWRRVNKTTQDDCWIWQGNSGPAGPLFGAYIMGANDTHEPRMTQARRIAYAEAHGEWPRHNLYHACGNRSCMNPDHYTDRRPTSDIYKNYRQHHPEAL